MAKNMARIDNGIVVNIEWCSEKMAETDTLKNIGDRPVDIGDTYSDGSFYHNGEKVLTPLEAAREEIADMKAALELLGVTADE